MSVFVLDTIRVLLYTIEPQHKDQKKTDETGEKNQHKRKSSKIEGRQFNQ